MTDAASADETQLVLCPVMGSLVHAHELSGAGGGRTSLWSMFRTFRRLGLTMPMTILAIAPVPLLANGPWAIPRNLLTLSADLWRMGGHLFDHRSDTNVLEAAGGHTAFSEDEFERLASFADDTMLSIDDLARLISANNEREPSTLGHALSFVEFAALLRVYGVESDEPGDAGLQVPLSRLRSLYSPQSVPAGWTPQRRTGVTDVVLTVRALVVAQRRTR